MRIILLIVAIFLPAIAQSASIQGSGGSGLQGIKGDTGANTFVGAFESLPNLKETRITDFRSGHGYALVSNGTVIDDTAVHLNGTQSLKFTSNGAGAFGSMRSPTFSPVLDMTGKGFVIRVLVSDLDNVASGTNKLTFYASSVADMSTDWYAWEINQNDNGKNWVVEGEFITISLAFGDAFINQSPVRSTIRAIQMVVRDDSTGTASINWATVGTFVEQPKGKVVLVFDQSHDDQYNEAKKKMSEYGMPGVSYLRPELIDVVNRVTTAQLLELQNLHGWEIALRTQGVNPADPGTIEDKEALINADLQILSDKGFASIAHFAYPNTDFDKPLYDLIKKKFRTARHGGNGTLLESYPPGDWHAMRCKSVGTSTTTGELASMVDQAVNDKQLVIILFHEIVATTTSGSQISIANFGTFIDDLQTHVAAGDIEVVTMSQAVNDLN